MAAFPDPTTPDGMLFSTLPSFLLYLTPSEEQVFADLFGGQNGITAVGDEVRLIIPDDRDVETESVLSRLSSAGLLVTVPDIVPPNNKRWHLKFNPLEFRRIPRRETKVTTVLVVQTLDVMWQKSFGGKISTSGIQKARSWIYQNLSRACSPSPAHISSFHKLGFVEAEPTANFFFLAKIGQITVCVPGFAKMQYVASKDWRHPRNYRPAGEITSSTTNAPPPDEVVIDCATVPAIESAADRLRARLRQLDDRKTPRENELVAIVKHLQEIQERREQLLREDAADEKTRIQLNTILSDLVAAENEEREANEALAAATAKKQAALRALDEIPTKS